MESEYEVLSDISQATTRKPTRGQGFSIEEDKVLISAWLNTSMDSIQGKEQKYAIFWGRITEYFHQAKEFESDRSQLMLTQRWGRIQKEVNKFSGCFASINERSESGKTEQDKIADAKKMYEAQERSKFKVDHAWIFLRHQPKWIQLMQEIHTKNSKTKKGKSQSTPTVNISSPSTIGSDMDIEDDLNTLNPIPRPPGRKTEKRKLAESNDQLKVIQKLHLEKKERDEKKLELMKEKIEIDKEKLRVRKMAADNRRVEAEMKIMFMDTSHMNPEQRAYYSICK